MHNGLRSINQDRSGVVLILFALLLPFIVGMVGLGVETGIWYSSLRKLQSATDAATIAAVYEVRNGKGSTTVAASAEKEAIRNGYDASKGYTISVQVPTTGSYVGDDTAREAILTKPIQPLFSAMFLTNFITINTRAVATLTKSSEACILALDPTSNATFTNQGSADINLLGCSIAVNSAHSTAMALVGASVLSTECISIVGNYTTGGSSSLTTTCPAPVTNALPVLDPYVELPDPAIGACDQNNFSVSSGVISPGTYCNGINFSGNVILDPGVYIIDRGAFKVNAGATLTSNGGVTIFLTSSTGSQYASTSINGGSNVTLSAPTSGTYSGVLFYGDRDAPTGINQTLNGGGALDLTGAIYYPVGDVIYTGGASFLGSCNQIIGYTITFNGNTKMNNSCDGGMSSIDIKNNVSLVE